MAETTTQPSTGRAQPYFQRRSLANGPAELTVFRSIIENLYSPKIHGGHGPDTDMYKKDKKEQ